MDNPTRPIVGIENRTPREVFDIMCDRIIRTWSADTRTPDLIGELVAARDFVVMTLAFIHRDRSTDRIEKTLDDVCREAAEVDRRILAALAKAKEIARGE